MAEQGAVNETGKQGHDERNKVEGEGPTNTSTTSATSGTGAGGQPIVDDPDAPPPADLGPDRGGPSMATRVADPGRLPPEKSSYAPGGDTVSQPGVKADDLLKVRGGRDEKPSDIPGRR